MATSGPRQGSRRSAPRHRRWRHAAGRSDYPRRVRGGRWWLSSLPLVVAGTGAIIAETGQGSIWPKRSPAIGRGGLGPSAGAYDRALPPTAAPLKFQDMDIASPLAALRA